jgi:hypothetical protein
VTNLTLAAQPDPKVRRKAAHGRSAVTNGKRLFVESLDERTVWARRYRDLINSIASDAGGIGQLSELRLALVRRAAAIIVEIERLEGCLAKGELIDVDVLGRLTGHLRRLAETLGLDRVSRDVTPQITLADLVRAHREETAQAAARASQPSPARDVPADDDTLPSEAQEAAE